MAINNQMGEVMSLLKKLGDVPEIVRLFTELVEAQNPQKQQDIDFLLYSTWSVSGALKGANIPVTQETASMAFGNIDPFSRLIFETANPKFDPKQDEAMDLLMDMAIRKNASRAESVDIAAMKRDSAASIDLNERIRSALAAGFRSVERFSGLGSDAEVLDAAADTLARAWLAKLDKVVNKERFWEHDTLFSFQEYVGRAFVESVVEQGGQDRPEPPLGMH